MASSSVHKALFYRWEALLAAALAAGLWLAAGVLLPVSVRQWRAAGELLKHYKGLREAESIDERIAYAQKRAASLDSLVNEYEEAGQVPESDVVGKLYRLADSAGCNAAKVEVQEAVRLEAGMEVPVVFTGEGTYAAIGKLVAGVESLTQATRVRQLTVKNEGNGRGAVVLDFVLMRSGKGMGGE